MMLGGKCTDKSVEYPNYNIHFIWGGADAGGFVVDCRRRCRCGAALHDVSLSSPVLSTHLLFLNFTKLKLNIFY